LPWGCSSTAVIVKDARPRVRKAPQQGSLKSRRNWKRCRCQICASGTPGGKFRRQCTDKWEWDKAEEVIDAWQKAGSWPNPLKQHAAIAGPETQSPKVIPVQIGRGPVLEVLEAYLPSCKSRAIKGSTPAKYETLANQLKAYCDHKGYTYIDQVQVRDMDDFYAHGKMAKRASPKNLSALKASYGSASSGNG